MYIHVEAHPRSRKESLVVKDDDHFVITIKEKAERGEANERIRELLGLHFGIPVKKIRIVNGHRSPKKLLRIEE